MARERYLARVVKLGPMVRWPAPESPELSRRFEAVLELLNLKATPRGIMRLAAWLLANPGAVTSLQMPSQPRRSPRFDAFDEGDSIRTNLPPPSDANAAQIKLFRHYVEAGLTKADAAKRTAAEINAERKVIENDDGARRKDASAESIKKLAFRYRGHPLPAWCDKVDQTWESQRWLERIERAAGLSDPFFARVERLTAAFDEGRLGAAGFRQQVCELIEDRVEHAALSASQNAQDNLTFLPG